MGHGEEGVGVALGAGGVGVFNIGTLYVLLMQMVTGTSTGMQIESFKETVSLFIIAGAVCSVLAPSSVLTQVSECQMISMTVLLL